MKKFLVTIPHVAECCAKAHCYEFLVDAEDVTAARTRIEQEQAVLDARLGDVNYEGIGVFSLDPALDVPTFESQLEEWRDDEDALAEGGVL